jgi:hypothetical protein
MTRTGTCIALAAASILALSPSAEAQTTRPGTATSGRRPDAPPRFPQPAKPGPAGAERIAPQGFSVVLVLGDLQNGTIQDTVPAAARKALTDMKDFLPYKGYRLLDVQWTLCCGRGSSAAPAISRLRGADGHEYELSLVTDLDSRNRLGVRFVLRDPSAAVTIEEAQSESITQLQREQARLEEELSRARKTAQARFEVGTGGPLNEDKNLQNMESRLSEIKIRLAEARDRRVAQARRTTSSRAVIDTSFTMDIGETVVVGTSRLAGGDKALIALLTAVANR